MPVCPTCHSEPPYQVVLRDRYIRKSIECVSPYLLGQPNQARRIRDIDGVLQKYIDLGVSFWAYLAFLLRLLLLGGNCTAIIFAFITYKSNEKNDWHFEIPTRVVVWVEFIVICCYLLWMTWCFLLLLWKALKEFESTPDNVYKCNLEVCTAVRKWYNAVMWLDFNLLLLLRYVTPPAVVAALGKARRRVYGKYGTRVHREQCCADFCCCCCFYGRLIFCTLFQGAVVVLLAAFAILGVFLKVLQLRFLGSVDIRSWSITELLLFGQFVVNMAWLDSRQKDRRAAKLELLYHGSDAECSTEESEAVRLVEDLALLALRHHYSLPTAVVVHHSLTAEDISYIYIDDRVEADKPRNQVKHEYKTKSDAVREEPPRMGRSVEWARHTAPSNGNYTDSIPPDALNSGQVVLKLSPQQGRKSSTATAVVSGVVSGSSSGTRSEGAPSAPPILGAPPLERFPYDFYTYGHAVGAPLQHNMQDPELKERYERSLWRGGAR